MATVALVTGVTGLLFTIFSLGFSLLWPVGIGLAVTGVSTALSARRRIRDSGGLLGGTGSAQAGLITGVIGTVLSVGGLIVVGSLFLMVLLAGS